MSRTNLTASMAHLHLWLRTLYKAGHKQPSGKYFLESLKSHQITLGIMPDCQQIDEYPRACHDNAYVDHAPCKRNQQLQRAFPIIAGIDRSSTFSRWPQIVGITPLTVRAAEAGSSCIELLPLERSSCWDRRLGLRSNDTRLLPVVPIVLTISPIHSLPRYRLDRLPGHLQADRFVRSIPRPARCAGMMVVPASV